jgi:hypothetical protein
MRFMLTFRIPPEEGNAAMKDGRFMSTFQSIMEELQPEAAYFGPIEGARGGYLVVNMDDASQIAAIGKRYSSDWAPLSKSTPCLPQTTCPG